MDIEEVVAIVRELPDYRMNPKAEDGAMCYYTSPADSNCHCIAGEFATRVGWELPDINQELNFAAFYSIWDEYNYPIKGDSAELLSDLQKIADAETIKENPWAWGEAKKRILADYAIGYFERFR